MPDVLPNLYSQPSSTDGSNRAMGGDSGLASKLSMEEVSDFPLEELSESPEEEPSEESSWVALEVLSMLGLFSKGLSHRMTVWLSLNSQFSWVDGSNKAMGGNFGLFLLELPY